MCSFVFDFMIDNFVLTCDMIFLCSYRAVARAVGRLISLALDLRSDFFDQPVMLGDPTGILRLLHYEGEAFVIGCIPIEEQGGISLFLMYVFFYLRSCL